MIITTITTRVTALLTVVLLIASLAGCAGRGSTAATITDNVLPAAPAGAADNSQPANQSDGKSANAVQPEKTPPLLSRLEVGVPEAGAATIDSQDKTAYLTFDDGPNSIYTGRVLNILADRQVKATFMVTGKNADINGDIMRRIVDERHGIGNHTFSHDYNKIYASPEAFLADLEECNKILIQYTGKPVMVFRAPGGPQKLSPACMKYLNSHGYISVGWNVTSADSDPNGATPSQIYNNIVSGVEKVEKLGLSPIILMHDGTQLNTTVAEPETPLAAYIQNRESTIRALPDIIDHLKSKGYKFALVDEHTPPTW